MLLLGRGTIESEIMSLTQMVWLSLLRLHPFSAAFSPVAECIALLDCWGGMSGEMMAESEVERYSLFKTLSQLLKQNEIFNLTRVELSALVYKRTRF